MKKIILLLMTFLLVMTTACTDDSNKGNVTTTAQTEATNSDKTTVIGSDETAVSNTDSATATTKQTEDLTSQNLSEKGVLKVVDIDRSEFSEKIIKYEDRLILDETIEGKDAKIINATDKYLMICDKGEREEPIYRYDINTLEFIDKKIFPKPKPLPLEAEFEDGLKAYNNISFYENNIVVAQPEKILIYDEDFNIKAEYSMNPDSEYVKNYYFYGAKALDESHIIYSGYSIIDLKTGNEIKLQEEIHGQFSFYGSQPSAFKYGKIFMHSTKRNPEGQSIPYEGPDKYIYTIHDDNGKLIEYCFEKNLKDNNAIISIEDETIYRFPKNDEKVKLSLKRLINDGRTDFYLTVKNYIFNCVSDDKLYDLKNKISYSFEMKESPIDGVEGIIDSCTYNGKTYLLLSTYHRLAPNFVVVI